MAPDDPLADVVDDPYPVVLDGATQLEVELPDEVPAPVCAVVSAVPVEPEFVVACCVAVLAPAAGAVACIGACDAGAALAVAAAGSAVCASG